ncbi:MAG: hypothetical protein QOK48_2477 [Blastocatellia bacterium]|jgi:hypothetical protein|nr:hypothetical protein [Blastocatellia bacterium]
MTENSAVTTNVLSEAALRHLRALRLSLLHLHKILLDMERADFERVSGPLNSGELLQLVINHAQFAWLRKLSALVVQIDELIDAEDPALPGDLESILTQARSLFTAAADQTFSEKYQAALQRNPEAVMAHAKVTQILKDEAS